MPTRWRTTAEGNTGYTSTARCTRISRLRDPVHVRKHLVWEPGDPACACEGESRRLKPGDTAFVAVGKEHHFVDYERISVLVLFARRG